MSDRSRIAKFVRALIADGSGVMALSCRSRDVMAVTATGLRRRMARHEACRAPCGVHRLTEQM